MSSSGPSLGIIPARGGSKGIPGKNLRPVGGKPLIEWSISHALATPELDRVVVTTDDPEIADVARKAGAEVPFVRPAHLATDTASTEAALLHAVDWLADTGYRPERVVLLQPTCPIRRSGAAQAALCLQEDRGADSVLSVSPVGTFLWQDGPTPTATYDWRARPRRQEIPASELRFRENGSIYVTRTEVLQTNRNRLGGSIALFVMSELEGVDIDTAADLHLADLLLSSDRLFPLLENPA